MLRRISLFLLLFFSSIAQANLNYETWACPSWPCPTSGQTKLSSGILTTTLNYDWGGGQVLDSGRSDYVVVHLTGSFVMPGTAGQSYQVYFLNQDDDGSRLKIGNTVVIEDWSGLHGPTNRGGGIVLVGGQTYAYERWFSEWGGGAVMRQLWQIYGIHGSYVWMNAGSDFFTVAPQPVYSSSISGAQTIRKNNLTTTRDALTNNNIYIDQAGDNNTINIEQSGNNNSIQGINQQRAKLLGNGNNITIKQGDPIDLTGKNLIKLETNGASNTLNLTQGRNPLTGLADGAESNGHILSLGLTGNSNNVSAKQSNDGGNNSGHFAEINISGNTNMLNLTQGNNTGKTFFGSVTGNNNSLTASQTGTGADFLDITLTGNGHNVNSAQSGTGNHAATINLTNSGGASSVTLTQGGRTVQTNSIQQSCSNPAGRRFRVTKP